jgi:L-threonylcarbamoyladenylate synthase
LSDVVAAVRAGLPVLLPTDTVYGLATAPDQEEAVRRLARLKGRSEEQPIALVAASVDVLREFLPELEGAEDAVARSLLPGPYTLVVPNPLRRLPWLSRANPSTIGVRVPTVGGVVKAALDDLGAVAATSANLHGGPEPRRLADVAPSIRAACAASLDGGELPGIASTVLDLTATPPRVLREGAVSAGEALARVSRALGRE